MINGSNYIFKNKIGRVVTWFPIKPYARIKKYTSRYLWNDKKYQWTHYWLFYLEVITLSAQRRLKYSVYYAQYIGDDGIASLVMTKVTDTPIQTS